MLKTESSRIIAIGDIHGRDTWMEICHKEEDPDTKKIFVGDYWDSFDIPFRDQLDNFAAILEHKRVNPQEVTLLIGNHDYQYMRGVDQQYSGYQEKKASLIGSMLDDAWDEGLLNICHVEREYLFTHAGVTKTWATMNGIAIANIEEEMHLLFENNRDAFRFSKLDITGYGQHCSQAPIWVRPESLVVDVIPHYTQVIGHTQQKHIKYYEGEYPAKIILIDAIHAGEYLIITDRKVEIGHVK